MREIVHIQAGQCGNQIGAKVNIILLFSDSLGHDVCLFPFINMADKIKPPRPIKITHIVQFSSDKIIISGPANRRDYF